MPSSEVQAQAPDDVMELEISDLLPSFDKAGFVSTSELEPRPLACCQHRALSAVRALFSGNAAQLLTLCVPEICDGLEMTHALSRECGVDDLKSLRSIRRKALFGDKDAPGLLRGSGIRFALPALLFLEHPGWLPELAQILSERPELRLIIWGSAADLGDLMLLSPELAQAPHSDLGLEFHASVLADLLGGIIASSRELYGTKDFTYEAVTLLAALLMRLSGDRHYAVIPEIRLLRFIREVSARTFGSEVHARDVWREACAWDFRTGYIARAALRDHQDGQLLIKTSGKCVGQINGLSVIETSGTAYEYGEPVRITAAIRAGGDGEIADIERKAELAGQIHGKAMMIVSGFLAREFGGVLPLPASPSLVFEQSYSEIDGDSASLTALCAVLSAFSELPLRQDLAVTGSCDQFGNVQSVGGVNQKIEGFFRICRMQGLTGTQGVILPESCVSQLVLRPAVVSAIKAGRFHLYTVRHVSGAMKLLSGCEWGGAEVSGSVVERVLNRMELISSRGESAPWWHFW